MMPFQDSLLGVCVILVLWTALRFILVAASERERECVSQLAISLIKSSQTYCLSPDQKIRLELSAVKVKTLRTI